MIFEYTRANGGGADMTATSDVDLVETVRRAKCGEASPQDVFDTFLRTRVYCERPEVPGFLTVIAPDSPAADASPRSRILDLATATVPEPPQARLVPVFTSLEQFQLFTGGGAWFSTTGTDLLGLLPPGVDAWLDPAAEHTVRLASAAVAVEPVLHISYRPRGGAA